MPFIGAMPALTGAQEVPLATVLGADRLPAPAAATIKKALDKLVSKKELPSDARWQALESWAKTVLHS